jgi:hypothetical protein
MANATLPKVLKQWRDPQYEDFEDRTAWSLMNGFTEVFKDTNAMTLPQRSTRLHGLLDMVVEATEQRALVEDLIDGTDKSSVLAEAVVLEDVVEGGAN